MTDQEKKLTSEPGEADRFIAKYQTPNTEFILWQSSPVWKTMTMNEVQAREVALFLCAHLGIETVEGRKARLSAQGRASR